MAASLSGARCYDGGRHVADRSMMSVLWNSGARSGRSRNPVGGLGHWVDRAVGATTDLLLLVRVDECHVVDVLRGKRLRSQMHRVRRERFGLPRGVLAVRPGNDECTDQEDEENITNGPVHLGLLCSSTLFIFRIT